MNTYSRRSAKLATVLIILTASVLPAWSPPPVHADSEASSEAGLEAPTAMRRRNRMMYRRQMMQEQKRDRQYQAREARADRQLVNAPDSAFVKNYGGNGRNNRQGGRRRMRMQQMQQQYQQQSNAQTQQQGAGTR